MIDSKNWSGDVRIVDGTLRQNGRSREKAIHAAADAALAVAELAGPHADKVHPVLCFAGHHDLSGRAGEVLICSVGNLGSMLRTRTPVLSGEQVHQVATRLDASMLSATQAPTARPVHAVGRPAPPPETRVAATRRSKRLTPGRFLAVLGGAVLLMSFGPMIAAAVGDAVAGFVVDTTRPGGDTCGGRQPAEAQPKDRPRADSGRQRVSAATEDC